MSPRAGARTLLGASAVLFGVISLIWQDADTWQTLHKLWSLPFGGQVGLFLMIAQIAGGITLPFLRTTRLASVVLCVVYLVFSVTCLSGIVRSPTVYAAYGSFFEQFCLLCGAVAAFAATQTDALRRVVLSRAARIGIGLCAVSFMLGQIFYFRFTAKLVPQWIPPNQIVWVDVTTAAFGIAAIATLINCRVRLALRGMALMTGLFGLLVWVPMLIAHPEAHGNWSELALTFLITGAIWTAAEHTVNRIDMAA